MLHGMARPSAVSACGWTAALRGCSVLPLSGLIARVLVSLAMLLLFAGAALRAGPAQAEATYLDPEVAFVLSVAMTTPTEVGVHFKIAPDYYMYRERFDFELKPDPDYLGQAIYPAGIVKYDPTFEKDLEVYHDQITIRVPVKPGAAVPLQLAITGQGCAEAGLCYPPMTKQVRLVPTDAGYQAEGDVVVASVPAARAQSSNAAAPVAAETVTGFGAALGMSDTGFAAHLASSSWLNIVALCLALGVLLSFTPCVLPMVPILLAIVAGGTDKSKPVSRWRGLSLAAAYVLGMSLVYTALGVVAGLVGASLAVWLQTPWVLSLFAILLSLLALAMFDVFTVQVPAGMQNALNRKLAAIPGGHYSGAFVMGMLSALIVGPCVAAPLAGVLLFISQTGDLVLGGLSLFALAWGEGLLLLVVGASSGALLPKAGAWMEGIKRLFGILLLATAWWMVYSVLPAWVEILGWAFLAAWSAVMLRAFESLPDQPGVGRSLCKAVGLLLAAWAAVLLIGLAAGGRDLLRPLSVLTNPGSSSSVATGTQLAAPAFKKVANVGELDRLLAGATQPVMLDFYADWCVSCIEMEKFTFSDPNVAQKMSRLLLVQADVTKNSVADRELLKRFKLFGPPGIIFFDAQGRPLPDLRVVGFKNAEQFNAVLDRVLATRPAL